MSNDIKNLKVLHDNIIFQFVEEVTDKGAFKQQVGSLTVVENADKQADKPRWAKVLMVGDEVTKIEPNEFIYIKPLQWTPHMKFNKEMIWATDESQVIMKTEVEPIIE